jgi:hypothetical protein
MGRALAGALARSPAPRSPGRRARDAAVSVDRQHPIDLAILGIESFGRSVAGLQGSVDRRSRTARARSAARTAPRSLRQVMR